MKTVRRESLLKILRWFFILIFFLISVGFARLTLTREQEISVAQIKNPRKERGTLYDRNGRLLAIQIRQYSLEAWRPLLEEPSKTAQLLAPILGLQQKKLEEKLTLKNPPYTWIKRFLSDRELKQVRNLISEEQITGMRLLPEYSRIYPQGTLASHLIGFTNIDNDGLDGVERTMDGWLSASEETAPWEYSNVVYGNDVYLTIDIETQYLLDKIASRALKQQQADHLITLLVDAKNGEILSYLSLPEYNPGRFFEYDEQARRNLPVTDIYEPGSVFKIFPMAIFLDDNLVDLDEILDIGTRYYPETFEKYKIRPITDVTPHAALTPTEVLIYSSNVGMATLSERIDSDRLYQRITDFGFGRITGIQLPGESSGLLRKPELWSLRTKPTIVFGQELAVTALQIVSAATALSNGGVLLEPQIIQRVVNSSGVELLSGGKQVIREIIKPSTAANVLLMMEQVVASPFGTMSEARVESLRIAGKSGTAQVFDPQIGRYDQSKVNSSILAIFPAEDPQFILYISLLNPKGKIRYGGRIASPVAREIIFALANRYHLPLSGNRIARHSGQPSSVSLLPPQRIEINDKLPSLLGFSKKELLPLLTDKRIRLEINGKGRVVRQRPTPGTSIPEEGLQVAVFLQ